MSKPLPVIQPVSAPGAEHLVEVAFKGVRRGFYTTADESIREGDQVVVEAERGHDLGRVRSVGGVARSKCSSTGAEATYPIVRRAEPEEARAAIVLRADEDRVRRQTRELVEKHRLKMKVSDAEWQWDRNKLTIYFTAERRVDFRELVRELARTFRTRIELKQIGVRDEAAMLGGVGRCGRELCCATWLREIRPVSLQLAKDQNLSLNPSQISGTCGRLMCCLTYEHDAYLQARKRFPREGRILQTSRGAEKVIGIDIWRDSVTLLDESRQRRVVPLAELKREMAPAGGPKREAAPQRQAAEESPERAAEARSEARPRTQAAEERAEARPRTPAAEEPSGAPEDAPRRRGRRGSGRQRRPGAAAAPPASVNGAGNAGGPPAAGGEGSNGSDGAPERGPARQGRRKRGQRSGGARDA